LLSIDKKWLFIPPLACSDSDRESLPDATRKGIGVKLKCICLFLNYARKDARKGPAFPQPDNDRDKDREGAHGSSDKVVDS
jgi:hypothetical protein